MVQMLVVTAVRASVALTLALTLLVVLSTASHSAASSSGVMPLNREGATPAKGIGCHSTGEGWYI